MTTKELKQAKGMLRRVDRMLRREQVVRIMERALAFYAKDNHWRKDDWGVPSVIEPPEYGKPGEKARAALRSLDRFRKRTHK